MLQAGNAENRAVGVEGIRAIRPHSLEAVRELREVAARTDAPGRAAKEVLQELAQVYITEIEAGPDREKRLELLELLGATAQSHGVDLLLEHLGQEAIDDHAEVRITAARALREIAAAAEFSPEQ